MGCCASTSRRGPISRRSQAEFDKVAAELNGRPRQTLGWMNPAEKMAGLLEAGAGQSA